MFDEFQQTAQTIIESARATRRLDPQSRLRPAEGHGPRRARRPANASTAASMPIRSRCRGRPSLPRTMSIASSVPPSRSFSSRPSCALANEEIISIDVNVGDGREGVTARLIVPRRFAHLAYAGAKLFTPAVTDRPDLPGRVMFFDRSIEPNKSKPLPEKDIAIRLAHAADGRLVKFVRNSNYFGEWKKGVFAGENYRAKLNGDAIFLHAGCRKDTLENRRGDYVTNYSLFVALSANGKTSTTCRVLGPQRPRAVVAHPGRRRHAVPRRTLPRLRGRRPVHQDRLPQPGRPDRVLLRLPPQGHLPGERGGHRRTAASISTTSPAPATAARSSNAATSCTRPATSTPGGSTTCSSSPAATSSRPSPSSRTSRRRPSWCWGSRWNPPPAIPRWRARSRTSSSTIPSSPATAATMPTCSTTFSRAMIGSTATC